MNLGMPSRSCCGPSHCLLATVRSHIGSVQRHCLVVSTTHWLFPHQIWKFDHLNHQRTTAAAVLRLLRRTHLHQIRSRLIFSKSSEKKPIIAVDVATTCCCPLQPTSSSDPAKKSIAIYFNRARNPRPAISFVADLETPSLLPKSNRKIMAISRTLLAAQTGNIHRCPN
ncbi:hypothetical protein ACLOJK_012938 [Asimina triloba]